MPIADAVFNVAAAATLTLGLATGSWDLIAAGLSDRLTSLTAPISIPARPSSWSTPPSTGRWGPRSPAPAPPSWCGATYEQTGAVIERLKRAAEGWAEVLRAPFESQGADVREL